MDNEARFSASDLAELLKVPRTTVNDWISRYSQYIDFKLQGKRKIYTQASVNVLKEISELRDKGLSSFDIEGELAKRHPVHAEQISQVEEARERSQTEENNQAAPGEEYALIVKKQTDEIGRLISEQLLNMSKRLEDLEHVSRVSASKSSKYYVLTVFLLVLFSIVMAAAAFQLASSVRENQILKNMNSQYSSELSENEKALEKITFKLHDDKTQFENNIKELQSQVEEQKKEFENNIKTKLSDAEQKKEAELRLLRDKFAAERLELLKKIEASSQTYSTDPISFPLPPLTPTPVPAAPLP